MIEQKLRDIVSKGLVRGLGKAEPGKLCVEAAVCLALGEPHGDNPSCVGGPQRLYSIRINDAPWGSDTARAAGLIDWAAEHLDSADLTQQQQQHFAARLAELTARRVLPISLRAVGLAEAAERCEKSSTAYAAGAAAYAAADAAAYASRVAARAAADAVARAAAGAAAYAAADAAARAAARAACAAAYAAADAAAYASRAAARAAADSADDVLRTSVECARQALREARGVES